MKIKFQILLFIVFLGLGGQLVHSCLFYSKFQTVLVEEEAKKNEKSVETEKEKFFESPFLNPEPLLFVSFILILKENFQTGLFHSLPERPPIWS